MIRTVNYHCYSFQFNGIVHCLTVFSFQQLYTEGKMQDATCAFYKLQEILTENPGILSEDEVIFLLILNCIGLSKTNQIWGLAILAIFILLIIHPAKKEKKNAMKYKI